MTWIIERQQPTGGIFYCRDSAEINGCGSHQTSSRLDSDVLRNRQQKHTAKTLAARLRKKTNYEKNNTYINFSRSDNSC